MKLFKYFENQKNQEIYEYHRFYPSISEYYKQLNQPIKAKDPLISIILPTYNTNIVFLKECIESVLVQSYTKWELCIADDFSTNKDVEKTIRKFLNNDKRIKFVKRKRNGHISEASNSALALAVGDFVALLDHDDILWPNALFELVKVIRHDPNIDFIYTDEDKIDYFGKNHSYPFLKPNFSPEFLECCNYITHLSCIRRTKINEIGGFRKGYEGAQDWDLFIRISEITDRIYHIPKILYSWRIHENSTAMDTDSKPYVYESQKKLLEDHLKRMNLSGKIEKGLIPQHRAVFKDIKTPLKTVVLIEYSNINDFNLLIKSILSLKTGYEYTIKVLSKKKLSKFERTNIQNKIKNVDIDENIDNNLKYISELNSEHVFFIKDTIRIMTINWIKNALSDLQDKKVFAVSPLIFSKDKKNILAAGVGINYGPQNAQNMLENVSFEDNHYTRGLYLKSKRNITAFNGEAFAINVREFKKIYLENVHQSLIDLSIEAIKKGYRIVYNPYIMVLSETPLFSMSYNKQNDFEDPCLNPNFNHKNGNMELKT